MKVNVKNLQVEIMPLVDFLNIQNTFSEPFKVRDAILNRVSLSSDDAIFLREVKIIKDYAVLILEWGYDEQ